MAAPASGCSSGRGGGCAIACCQAQGGVQRRGGRVRRRRRRHAGARSLPGDLPGLRRRRVLRDHGVRRGRVHRRVVHLRREAEPCAAAAGTLGSRAGVLAAAPGRRQRQGRRRRRRR
uniref:Uncharacterized protein n=1 Tax=Oryza glaberrima TaxID=4538 RepID=I1PI27_ORYGL